MKPSTCGICNKELRNESHWNVVVEHYDESAYRTLRISKSYCEKHLPTETKLLGIMNVKE